MSSATTEKQELPVVLHVRVVSGTGGGPEKTILNSPRFLTSLGFDARCAYMRAPNDAGFHQIAARAKTLGAPLIEIDDRGPLDPRVVTKLLGICRRNKVSVWHGHDYKSNAIGLLVRRFHEMKLVTTVHGWVKFTRRTPLYYGIDRFALRYYDRVIAVSEDLRQRCVAAGVREERCLTIKNAIDTEQYHRTQSLADAKIQLGACEGRFLIGAVGRLSDEKGFDLLIRVVDRLIREGHDVGLMIAGEGEAREDLARLIAQVGQSERIRLVGYQSQMLPFYEALDCFVLSSLREGLPNVVLEAMALAVPVVATSVAGVPDLVVDGETGLLIEPNDAEKLFNTLKMMLTSEELRTNLGRAGQAKIDSDFSFRRRMERIARVYGEVLSKTNRATPN